MQTHEATVKNKKRPGTTQRTTGWVQIWHLSFTYCINVLIFQNHNSLLLGPIRLFSSPSTKGLRGSIVVVIHMQINFDDFTLQTMQQNEKAVTSTDTENVFYFAIKQ